MLETVTLLMPMRNEAAHLAETLWSIEGQTFDKSRLNFVAIDGKSTDNSVEVVRNWLRSSGIRGTVLTNPQGRIPSALNIGILHASPSDFIIRLDAHTTYGATYVSDIMETFSNAPPNVGCIGGAQIPASTKGFERAVVGELLTHPLGLARMGVRDLTKPVQTDTVYLGAWRPGVLQDLGGFDEAWVANEDSELEARLRAAGWTMLMIPSSNRYKVNRGLVATVRQWGNYGFWRAQTTRRHPQELRPRHIIPPATLATGLALLFTRWRYVDLVLFGTYGAGVVAFRNRDIPLRVTLACCIAFPLIQAVYTVGFVRGRLTKTPAFQTRLPKPAGSSVAATSP